MAQASDYLRATTAVCNATAIRQASRHISRFYNKRLGEAGLRDTQYVILVVLGHNGPSSIPDLAETLVMDRSTFGHALRPLEREGLVRMEPGQNDRRRRVVVLTETGVARLELGRQAWNRAQAEFEAAFGKDNAAAMREMMTKVYSLTLDADEAEAAA